MVNQLDIKQESGFTLIELAIVLIVVGYMLNQLIAPFGAQREQAMRSRTLQQLNDVVDNTVGFAISQRRLPCPAGIDTHGYERDNCSGELATGYVPIATLGMPGPTDEQGRLLDSWGRPIIYAVSASDHSLQGEQGMADFVTAGEMANVGLSHLNSELIICREVTAQTCSRANVRANQVPLIVLSLGADGSVSGQQVHNQNSDHLFVARPASRLKDQPFDDLVVWLSENKLIFNLVVAGEL